MRHPEKILIVEDNESLRKLYREELSEEGYECILAGNGREALQVLKDCRPDVVILDIVMPVMDGLETLGRAIYQYRGIPIILHTSYPHYREDFASWGADAYLTKSSDFTELKETIENLLAKKGKDRSAGFKSFETEVKRNESQGKEKNG